MTSPRAMLLPVVLLSVLACASVERVEERTSATNDAYLSNAHSHNDYLRDRPLFEALERGFASVEVDVHLVGDELLVAHDAEDVDASRTLSGLYLDPLRELVSSNGGSIYGHPGAPPLQLLIDVKTDAEQTYAALNRTLAAYHDVFTQWTPDGARRGPVTAVISGNRAVSQIAADTSRFAAIDGRITDPERVRYTPEVMPLISMDWEEVSPSAPERKLATARRIIDTVHREGRRIRFWGTTDDEEQWRSLLALEVDYVGTDDPGRLYDALRGTSVGDVSEVEERR